MSLVIPVAQFAGAEFAQRFSQRFVQGRKESSELDLLQGGLAGPLRMSGRNAPAMALYATVELHSAGEPNEHVHVALAATRRRVVQRLKVMPRSVPSLDTFLEAVAEATGTTPVSTTINGRHRFPLDSWQTPLEFPVPLLAFGRRSGNDDTVDASAQDIGGAQLTGVEVSFDSPSERQTVLLSARTAEMMAFTTISGSRVVTKSLVTDGFAASTALATRLLNEVVKHNATP